MDVIACGIEADDAALDKFSLQNIVHVVTNILDLLACRERKSTPVFGD